MKQTQAKCKKHRQKKLGKLWHIAVIVAAILSLSPWNQKNSQLAHQPLTTKKWVLLDSHHERVVADDESEQLFFTPAMPSLAGDQYFIPKDGSSYALYVFQQLQTVQNNFFSNLNEISNFYKDQFPYVANVYGPAASNIVDSGTVKNNLKRSPAIVPKGATSVNTVPNRTDVKNSPGAAAAF